MVLLENGRFYVPNHPNTTSMLVDKGLIRAIGQPGSDLQHLGQVSQRYDLKGKVVWPGLTDAHIHLTRYGLNLQIVNCDTSSRQECLDRVEQVASMARHNDWVIGHGWNQNEWPEGYGTATLLDAVSHNHPVYLTAKSLHAVWANTQAMEQAGIRADSYDIADGHIVRDASGNPNGIFLEAAGNLIAQAIPKPTSQEIELAILEGMRSLIRMGITSVHDFDSLDRLENYKRIAGEGRLRLHILKGIPPEDHQTALSSGLYSGMGNGLIHIGPYKFFMDGALGPHTAALLEPYNDDPANSGMLTHTSEEIVEISKMILSKASDLAIHAIGDRANQEAIEAYRTIRMNEATTGQKPARLRIEHAQLLSCGNLKDFKELDITASMQPLHATSDMNMVDRYWGDRKQLSYAWKSLLDNGARLVFGSDAPVESPNPFWGLHAAVTRQKVSDFPAKESWVPNQRITLQSALDAYTTNPAAISRVKSANGKLVPGSQADLILLEIDPFMIKAQELHQLHPSATMINGEWEWVDQEVEL
ncbi:MAG: amidohydrolase [Anaerolineaceae bacterium]|nr:amidohydrolase [Anaerolineaceae bacterium]MBN2676748.1 amidohydrolase [Anaerolineaceae bacterium]